MRPLRWWAESAPPGGDRVRVSEYLGATWVAPVPPCGYIPGGRDVVQTWTNIEVQSRQAMLRSSHFWFLVTFGDEVTKIPKYYVIFVYILKGKMGKTVKNEKKITQIK